VQLDQLDQHIDGAVFLRFIPTRIHGAVDYIVGLIVIGLPFFLDLQGASWWFFMITGAAAILYSLFTDYELGAIRFLRIRFHLLLDAMFGLIMLMAPLLLHLSQHARWSSYLIGALALLLVTTTKTRAVGTAALT
jgi:hypothetical protein